MDILKGKNKIIIIKGKSQYGALRCFADYYGEGFTKLGYEVSYIDGIDFEHYDSIFRAVLDLTSKFLDKIAFFFSINIVINPIINFCNDGISFYDYFNVPLIYLIVDSPVMHYKRLQENIKNVIYLLVDKKYVEITKDYYKKEYVFFCPQGGKISDKYVENISKDIDILFCGTLNDYEKLRIDFGTNLEALAIDPRGVLGYSMFDVMVEYVSNNNYSVIDAMKLYFGQLGIEIDESEIEILSILFEDSLNYVRGLKRIKLVKTLLESGLKITGYTNEKGRLELEKYSNFIYEGEIEYNDLLDIYPRAKIIINSLPGYTEGAHERIFNAMLNGVICVTDSNKYLIERFTDMEDIVFYSNEEIHLLPDKIKMILEDEQLQKKIRNNAREKVINSDTWDDRAKDIISIYNKFQLMKGN